MEFTLAKKQEAEQVYEQLRKKPLAGMKLRPYKAEDAKTIISWIKDERALRLWSAD